ncbi:MAG: MOSC domain-containing protein [Ignavibacteria bacterium]|nr:MOSC domain-containing protein [Ignavibacteria bacterium]
MLKLTEIKIYPVKSLGGISLTESEVTSRGFKYDRRWLLVDENGKFITQRTYPLMSHINVEIKEKKLVFSNKHTNESLSISLKPEYNEQKEVIIWNDKVVAEYVDKNADEWFSEMLKVKCSLVYMPENTNRFVDSKYAHNNEIVSFADAYPFMIIGQESLNDLNNKLEEKIPMDRFRPNLVFCGGEPFDEDKWKSFKIREIRFYPVKPCSRCVVTTIDQNTGIKNVEPLRTLATYRTINNKVMFGQNLLHKGAGIIKVGDFLTIEKAN